MEDLQYPIGKFSYPTEFTSADIEQWIADIEKLPETFNIVAGSMSEDELNTRYRPDGWTSRQVIHHVADSHMNAYVRFKWVLTEESPTIKAYFEDRWAELQDTQDTPITTSLTLLTTLHERWVALMRSLTFEDFHKFYVHPEYGKQYTLGAAAKLYAWHGKHHLAHLQIVKGEGLSTS